MGCCSEKRQALRLLSARTESAPPLPPVLQNPVELEHLGECSIVVKGARTGLVYLFGARGEVLAIDERDVSELLATKQFAPR